MTLKFSVTQFGKPLDKSKYSFDEKTRTFSTPEGNLVLDFTNISSCTFNTSSNCTFKTSYGCTFNTDWNCTFKTGSDCTFNTSSNCTFNTDWNCTFNTSSNCTFKTSYGCTFNTDWNCTFKTGENCTFDTGENCTFKTGENCTFNTCWDCTFKTGSDCAVIRRDVFEIIKLPKNKTLTLAPNKIQGYVLNGYYYKDDKKQYEAIIADGILSKIKSKKTIKNLTVYHVINHNEEEQTFLVHDGENYSHGETIKQAKDDLKYKISNRDTSAYRDYTLDTTVSFDEAIKMYRTIAGACERGTKYFVDNILKDPKEKYSVKEIIEITKGHWNHNLLAGFFKGKNNDR